MVSEANGPCSIPMLLRHFVNASVDKLAIVTRFSSWNLRVQVPPEVPNAPVDKSAIVTSLSRRNLWVQFPPGVPFERHWQQTISFGNRMLEVQILSGGPDDVACSSTGRASVWKNGVVNFLEKWQSGLLH